ncbi:hypothetical protein E0H93_34860 [Rhizobium leguminosarum bv. viciae]|uniref:phage baseplate assembly protein V n=1 Tax=Rhizobium leguminosarum TaxID=384 RepID=UPI00103B694A|nr:phage baseplate assembly protein V [Rhizobium leguminosarum]MBY5530189.1 hypothetical protein [Rhizobium leguminosarum]NKK29622.1 hypothetical protein [Rhizobium leguminosarum bv. viciae]TBY30661.1 hypothetical protein E0H55_20480 [Rhizobium leguminosarum bv. viciae]TBY35729.1 hypothetical protein E0H60_22905 [Rhizobium leguminosarum bv. viciae]TBZ54197.1 hypothetical protein E0H42_14240 [Rhizobium leguminosarum bv. viciae]
MTERPPHGKIRATVVSTADQFNSGKLKVQYSLGGPPIVTWADACVPYAGGKNGIHAIPPVGSGVWVEFPEVDPEHPIWTGCWWKDGELSGAFGAGAYLNSLPVVIQSTGQHRVILGGGGGDAVVIETSRGEQGPRIVMTESSLKISCGPTMSIEITASEVKINSDGLVVR